MAEITLYTPVFPRSGERASPERQGPEFGGEQGGWVLDGVTHGEGGVATSALGDIAFPFASEAGVRGSQGAASPPSSPPPACPAKSLLFCNNRVTSKMAFHNCAISLTG